MIYTSWCVPSSPLLRKQVSSGGGRGREEEEGYGLTVIITM